MIIMIIIIIVIIVISISIILIIIIIKMNKEILHAVCIWPLTNPASTVSSCLCCSLFFI